jgi:hypothetical protein
MSTLAPHLSPVWRDPLRVDLSMALLEVALTCVELNPQNRPKLKEHVVPELTKIQLSLLDVDSSGTWTPWGFVRPFTESTVPQLMVSMKNVDQ